MPEILPPHAQLPPKVPRYLSPSTARISSCIYRWQFFKNILATTRCEFPLHSSLVGLPWKPWTRRRRKRNKRPQKWQTTHCGFYNCCLPAWMTTGTIRWKQRRTGRRWWCRKRIDRPQKPFNKFPFIKLIDGLFAALEIVWDSELQCAADIGYLSSTHSPTERDISPPHELYLIPIFEGPSLNCRILKDWGITIY